MNRLLGVALCCVLFPLAGAQAQNLVSNPNFDHDLSGWIVQEGAAVWSADDAAASAFSGSMDAMGTSDQPTRVRSNCFAASPGNYLFELKHREPNAADPFGVNAFLRWYSDTECTILLTNSVSLNSTFHGPGWQTISTAVGVDVIAPPGAHSAALQLNGSARASIDDVVVARVGTCTSSVCLHDGRFAVDIRWFTNTSNGQARPIQVTSDSATYWFFGPNNIELVVKVLDGCAVNGYYWVFMAGLTNVRVEVTITDVASGETWTHVNPAGTPFPPIQDTSAFLTCP
ncbi:MAG TPA: hypothetical protein VGS57_01445 [Thermoanaerobaculia bacterium]|jgi:hypothetical protein|nr:hypothetical protein [Thermoanaerobaculia bacterium]